MDAKVDDWVVTPRRGKPVEIQALWYNALQLMAQWAHELGAARRSYEELRGAGARVVQRALLERARATACTT